MSKQKESHKKLETPPKPPYKAKKVDALLRKYKGTSTSPSVAELQQAGISKAAYYRYAFTRRS